MLILDWLDPIPFATVRGDIGLWCTDCGQPAFADPDDWLYPVPLFMNGSYAERLPFRAVELVRNLEQP